MAILQPIRSKKEKGESAVLQNLMLAQLINIVMKAYLSNLICSVGVVASVHFKSD